MLELSWPSEKKGGELTARLALRSCGYLYDGDRTPPPVVRRSGSRERDRGDTDVCPSPCGYMWNVERRKVGRRRVGSAFWFVVCTSLWITNLKTRVGITSELDVLVRKVIRRGRDLYIFVLSSSVASSPSSRSAAVASAIAAARRWPARSPASCCPRPPPPPTPCYHRTYRRQIYHRTYHPCRRPEGPPRAVSCAAETNSKTLPWESPQRCWVEEAKRTRAPRSDAGTARE